jgi:large subunit ribosomal protein L28
MPRVCAVCGKKTTFGNAIQRRGLAKAKGGVGKKITSRVPRTFKPNLQSVKAVVDGTVRRIRVCVQCLRSGRVTKHVAKKAVKEAPKETTKETPTVA